MFAQLINVMQFMQEKGVMHRDLKPQNIMLDENFNVKVIDFGDARKVDEPLDEDEEEPVELDDEYRETAVRCAQIMGLNVAGVDMLEGKNGPQVMEVNSSPGLEGIETCTELDIAGAVVDYIAAQVDFPEIDVRQRLTVSKGYGVSEIYIPEGSEFVGKTVADFQLNDRELNVLTLYRGTRVIPNPRLSRELEAEDKLLCFGKLEVMRGMIPVRTRRRRRPVPQDLPDLDDSGSVAD